MITLKGITWQNPRGYNPLAHSAAAWQALHPDVRVIWEQRPWYEFEEVILASLAKGDNRYDLIMFDHPWVGKLASERWLVPWDSLLTQAEVESVRARVVAPSTESYELAGHLWALPLDAACHSSLYRSDLVSADDLPDTWEMLPAWAAARQRERGSAGLVLSLEGVLGNCLFLTMMAGLGYPALHDEDHPQFDAAAAEYCLSLIQKLLPYVPPGSTHWGPWDIYDHMCADDECAYSPSIFAYVNYFRGVSPRGDFLRLATVPQWQRSGQRAAILGGVGLGIAHTCPHLQAAACYGAYLMSDASQFEHFAMHEGQPAANAVWQNAEINERFHHFYRDLQPNMGVAYVRPRYPAFHAIELANGRALQRFWDGHQTLQETLIHLSKIAETESVRYTSKGT
jgi:multiple sugar transport system substrate-binding protein